ncbi:hypothetical protein ACPPVT_07475 [Angustibacter sp. McL0619]|uniref:hypothetical protein n=1 Tax=Angustibacter sp. McL0619 TaxID=3415676 RepID=UPI003CEF2B6B
MSTAEGQVRAGNKAIAVGVVCLPVGLLLAAVMWVLASNNVGDAGLVGAAGLLGYALVLIGGGALIVGAVKRLLTPG